MKVILSIHSGQNQVIIKIKPTFFTCLRSCFIRIYITIRNKIGQMFGQFMLTLSLRVGFRKVAHSDLTSIESQAITIVPLSKYHSPGDCPCNTLIIPFQGNCEQKCSSKEIELLGLKLTVFTIVRPHSGISSLAPVAFAIHSLCVPGSGSVSRNISEL